ncbi:MAG TPA: electron transfer flavoprotein-ubiquinone oxidoreductase [Casimicrobiaceae bacterium]|nr:electron transfer flavoprotein-ubiquinone oxidoreductase [Casimicrobiaceae bacterium]
MPERESMQYDVVIVGAGPAGLCCAIRLKQLAPDASVCVLEKGAQVGAHILSGAVLEPRALDELIPDWRERDAPITTAVTDDRFVYLTQRGAHRLPTPPQMHNTGNYVVSLGNVCRWLGEQAEAVGVDVFAGFAAAAVLYDDDGAVRGIATGDMGLDADGTHGDRYAPGMDLLARQTIIAEGCRGSLAESLIRRLALRQNVDPQTYGLGIKELWEIDAARHQSGFVMHTVGWPLDRHTYGGSFVYHLDPNLVAIGLVVGLDYANPYLSPFDEFQRFKTHPAIRAVLEGGRRLCYGARTLAEGGLQSVPKVTFAGGMLIGDSAGFVNAAKAKGIHTAMKSGMIAAEALHEWLQGDAPGKEILSYRSRLERSWIHDELKAVRNIRPAFRWGRLAGMAYCALDMFAFRGNPPWTLHHRADHIHLKRAAKAREIDYPKPDGVLTFDRMSSVFVSNASHREDQPSHIKLLDPAAGVEVNVKHYGAPESRYCPAGVYEVVATNGATALQINFTNCLHCKTCDIKDPTQNIVWTVPEGGGGPNYVNM